jgi:hypothetical protein
MNKKGNVYLGLVLAISLWIFGIMAIPFLTDTIDATRTDASCSDTSISSGSKLLCLFIDGFLPYFIWSIACLTLGLIVGGFR